MLTLSLLPSWKYSLLLINFRCVQILSIIFWKCFKKKSKPISKKKHEKDLQLKTDSSKGVLHHSCYPLEPLSCLLWHWTQYIPVNWSAELVSKVRSSHLAPTQRLQHKTLPWLFITYIKTLSRETKASLINSLLSCLMPGLSSLQ